MILQAWVCLSLCGWCEHEMIASAARTAGETSFRMDLKMRSKRAELRQEKCAIGSASPIHATPLQGHERTIALSWNDGHQGVGKVVRLTKGERADKSW
jgi:hypothetical protein